MYKFDFDILERQILKQYRALNSRVWSVNDYFIVIKYFIIAYKKNTGREHKHLSNDNLLDIMCKLPYADNEYSSGYKCGYVDFFPDDYINGGMIDKYFKTKFKSGCDYSIYHFLSDGVRAIKYYECCY